MTREGHVRFCEGPKVKFLRPTLLFIFNEAGLRRVMASYVSYFNHWRPHRSLRQRTPCDSTVLRSRASNGKIIAANILGGLHHVYWRAA
jgi:hypothetical protein